MRLLVECPSCNRQYDATRRTIGSRFRCHCGELVEVHRPEGHDARVVRCSACGAARSEGSADCLYCAAQFTLLERDLNTVCPHCKARVSDKARFCHHCGTGLIPELDAGTATKFTCPACEKRKFLVSRKLGSDSVSVLECGRCAGFWLGHEAFRQLIEQAQQGVLPPVTVQKNPRDVASQTGLRTDAKRADDSRGWKYRPCVHCGELMVRRNYGGESGVIVDLCRDHGIWFDAQELALILAWIRAGGTPRKVPTPDTEKTSGEPILTQRPRGFISEILDHLFGHHADPHPWW